MKKKTNSTEHKLNKVMLERIIIINNAIKSGIYPSPQRLRQIYCEQTGYEKVGEATIYRALDALRTYFHAPLEFDRTKGGYYYMDDKWEFALNNISEQEIFYLSSAKTLLSSFEGNPMYNKIAGVIDFITDTQTAGKSSLLKRIAVPPAPKANIDEDVWKKMLAAMQENCIVEFDYNGRWNPQTTHRRVHPYQFLLDDGMCFVFGYSEERKAERIFLLNRIKNLKLTENHFELPKDFEFSTHPRGGKFGAFIGNQSYNFTIDFYGDARQYVKECIWADDQVITDFESEDKTRIQFSSPQSLKVREWVLAQGGNAVPVSPSWFVDDWKAQVYSMAQRGNIL